MHELELPALTATVALPGSTPVAEAHGLIAAARAEADAIREAAWAEGLALGAQEGRRVLEQVAQALHGAMAALEDERVRTADVVEAAAVELGLRVADQVLGAVLELEPERVIDAVRGALRRLLERERVTVLVHPDDLELVREAAPALMAELGGMEHCEVQAERRVARGGTVVRTAEGEVDASVATKLARAHDAILEALTA